MVARRNATTSSVIPALTPYAGYEFVIALCFASRFRHTPRHLTEESAHLPKQVVGLGALDNFSREVVDWFLGGILYSGKVTALESEGQAIKFLEDGCNSTDIAEKMNVCLKICRIGGEERREKSKNIDRAQWDGGLRPETWNLRN